GHVSPEALAGGPIGKLRDGDLVRILIDGPNLRGSLDFVGENGQEVSPEEGAEILQTRKPADGLQADPRLPKDTRLWAALQNVSGGTWGGCVYDVDAIVNTLEAGQEALSIG
ncbi:MAG: dihydroxy-acid dehydratase, partial [Opitutales bacterium]